MHVHKLVGLCKSLLVSHTSSIVAELSAESGLRKEMVSVLAKFENYACFDAAFNSETAAEREATAAERDAEDPVDQDGEAPENKYEIFEKTLSKMPNAMLAFLFDTFSNKHDRDLEKLCRDHSGPLGMIRWPELDGAAGEVNTPPAMVSRTPA